MEEKDYIAFFEKYNKNLHSSEEHERFLDWMKTVSPQGAKKVMDDYARAGYFKPIADPHTDHSQLIKNIEARIDLLENEVEFAPVRTFRIWPYLRRFAAAAVLILIGAGSYYVFLNKTSVDQGGKVALSVDTNKLGQNRAMLTLSDGSKIDLNEAVDGKIANQSGIQIDKVADGQLVYAKEGATVTSKTGPGIFNQITTPKAGQYQINLSDGTRVWLNALSSIRFPAVFSEKERRVEITGEVYFEVAAYRRQNHKVPFLVVCNNQVIEVVGTHFNVNSYRDESAVKTTLLEGSVKVYATQGLAGKVDAIVKLKPGEQAIVKRVKSDISAISVKKVDTESAVAWQKGFFKFKDTNIQEVMRQLSRWYDLEVVYKGTLPHEQFTGYVSKKVAISDVLTILEEGGGVKFNVNDKKVEVISVE